VKSQSSFIYYTHWQQERLQKGTVNEKHLIQLNEKGLNRTALFSVGFTSRLWDVLYLQAV